MFTKQLLYTKNEAKHFHEHRDEDNVDSFPESVCYLSKGDKV